MSRTAELLAAVRSRLPGAAWLRLAVLVLLVVTAAVLLRFSPLRELVDLEVLLAQLERIRALDGAPLLFVAGFVALLLLGAPTSPLWIAGGITFGVAQGTALNYGATILGAVLTYALARGLAHDVVARLVGSRYHRIERLIHRRGFWSLVRIRFLPIPYFLVNVAFALAGVRPARFVVATALGMAPVTVIWTYFAASLLMAGTEGRDSAIRNLIAASILLLALSFVPPRYASWRRGRKLERLRAERHRARQRSAG